MLTRDEVDRKQRLMERADVVAHTVKSLKAFYDSEDCNENKKRTLETMVGAAIFYLPQPKEFYTGKTSLKAIEALENSENSIGVKLTKEHRYPRKIAAKELFELNWINVKEPYKEVLDRYTSKYGLYNYVLPTENKRLTPYQKADVFIDPNHSYEQAGITLLNVPYEVLQRIRKGDRKLANTVLSGQTC